MAQNTILIAYGLLMIGLAGALVLAVGVLIYGVGRIVYGITRDRLRERQPVREIQYPTYGLLTGEGQVWSGTVYPDGRKVPFTVSGTTSAPDEELLRSVGVLVGKFAEVERQAMEYLRANEAEIGIATLELYALEMVAGNYPDDFTLEFLADGSQSGVWRVTFEAGQPKRTEYDD